MLFAVALDLLLFVAAAFVQIIIHEAGHLACGLLSGYRFSSFRVASFMWVKLDGRIVLKRMTLAGTGGQCLMAPPDLVDGKIPVVLYNLGGSLANVASALVFLGLLLAFPEVPVLTDALFALAVVGVAFALMNGIPLRLGGMDNDGRNAWSLTRDDEALRAFWMQMKVNERQAGGVRLKDMPEEWFAVPSDEAMRNPVVAAVGVFACNRLMDERRFEEARSLMERLLALEGGMAGVHRSLLVCDLAYLELLGENRADALARLLDSDQRKFMKGMKDFPTVVRLEYAHALLHECDPQKAADASAHFEKVAATYPYSNDIASERELMELAAACAQPKAS